MAKLRRYKEETSELFSRVQGFTLCRVIVDVVSFVVVLCTSLFVNRRLETFVRSPFTEEKQIKEK